jgi:hypothetical protein
VSLLIPLLSASPFNSIVMLDYLCCFEEFKPWTRISLTAGYDQDFGVFLMWNMSMCELWPWFNFYALDFYEGHDSDFEPTLLLLMCFFCLCSWHLVKHDDDCIMKLLEYVNKSIMRHLDSPLSCIYISFQMNDSAPKNILINSIMVSEQP